MRPKVKFSFQIWPFGHPWDSIMDPRGGVRVGAMVHLHPQAKTSFWVSFRIFFWENIILVEVFRQKMPTWTHQATHLATPLMDILTKLIKEGKRILTLFEYTVSSKINSTVFYVFIQHCGLNWQNVYLVMVK